MGSDVSFRRVMEQLPKKTIHNQTPLVTTANKANLAKFEAQSKKDEPRQNGMGKYDMIHILETLLFEETDSKVPNRSLE